MKSNEQKLINLLVQSVLTVRTDLRLQQLTTEELVTWIRDNLTKLGFNVQKGNKFWIDYDGVQKIVPEDDLTAMFKKWKSYWRLHPSMPPAEFPAEFKRGASAQHHHVWCAFTDRVPCEVCAMLWKHYPDVTLDNAAEMEEKYHVTWTIQPHASADNSRIPLAILQEIRRLADFAIKKIEAIK